MRKRGQFFLLAAVIISAVVISLGAGTNRADVYEEPEDFYAASDEAQREIGAFLDYAVYNGFNGDDELIEFLDLMAESMRDKNPNMDFAFVYGSGNKVDVRNYGAETIYVSDTPVEGGVTTTSFVQGVGYGRTIDGDSNVTVERIILHDDNFSIGIDEGENILSFPTSDYRQVIIIMQKEREGERYVSVG